MDFRGGEFEGIIGCRWRLCVGTVDRGGLLNAAGHRAPVRTGDG